MKILYVGNDRQAAQLAAHALRGIAVDVKLTWTGSLPAALRWVQENRDVSAVVLETEGQQQACVSLVDHVRGLGLTAPIVLVASEQVGAPLLELKAGADDYVVNSHSLLTDLPPVLTRALERTRAEAHAAKTPLRLLYIGDAALARKYVENPQWSIQITEAVPESKGAPPAPPPSSFDVVLVEYDHPQVDAFAILKDCAGRRPQIPIILVVEWDEKLAIPALKLGAADCVVKAADAFRALFFKLDRGPAALAPLKGRAEPIVEEAAGRERLERQVREALATSNETQRSFNTAAEHFRQTQARLQATIDQERASRDALEAKLAAMEAAHPAAGLALETTPVAAESSQRRAEDTTRLEEAAATRAALETTVAELEAELARADSRRTIEAAAAAEQLAKVGAEFRGGLTHAIQARDNLTHQLSETTAALEESRRHRETEAAEAAAARSALEQQLAHAGEALQEAERRAAVERAAVVEEATKHQTALEERLAREAAGRSSLEQSLATAETAGKEADERHASALATAESHLADADAQYDAAMARAAQVRAALDEKLLELEAALRHADERRQFESAMFADRLANREMELTAGLDDATRSNDLLALRLSVAAAALESAQQDRSAEVAAAADRQARLAAALDDAVGARRTLERQLADVEAAHQHAQQRVASELVTAAARQVEVEQQLAQDSARRTALEESLASAEAARQNATRQQASALAESAERLAAVQARHDNAVADAAAARDLLEQQLIAAAAAHDDSRAERAADAAAAAERLTRRETELGAMLAEALAARSALEQRLADVELAHQHAQQRAAADLIAATERQAELGTRLAHEALTRTALQQNLANAEVARQNVHRQQTSELAASAGRLADVHAQYDEAVAQAAAARADFEQQLRHAAAALDDAANHLATREAELGATLAEGSAARSTLAQSLADVEAAHRHAQERAAADLAAAAARQIELQEELARESVTRSALEATLANAVTSRRDAEERQASELATAAAHVADVQAQYNAAVAQAAAARDDFEQQLGHAAAALDGARQEQAAEAAAAADRLAKREAELAATLAEANAARSALDQRLRDVELALQHAQQTAAAELVTVAARQAALEADLQQHVATRQALESDLSALRLVSTQARRRLFTVISTIRGRGRKQRARLEAQLDWEVADREQRLAAKDEECGTLQQSLGVTRDELQRLHDARGHDQARHERAQVTSASELQRLTAEYDQVREALDQVRSAFQALDLVSGQQTTECARLEQVLAARDAQLSADAASHVAAEQDAARARAQDQERFRLALDASGREIAQLQHELHALRQELDHTRADRETLRSAAARLPVLERQLDESQKEYRIQFERAPYGICRVTSDGALTHVNRSLVRLLGYRTAEELRQVDFATTVFETADDMRWIIERCLSTGTAEPVETTWRNKDRGRVIVRLQAVTAADQSIELIAEEITSLRAVEDQLRRAQRMEAVARLAAEVAVTCDRLLRDVTQDGEQWLAAIGSDTILRHQGEQLLGEVTRAASFLRQLGVYGNEQVNALEPVTVSRVIRDLEGVLKRVAGDDIELVLPRTSPAVEVDVDAERVERVLVNVASYARQRMPLGGRLKIELSTVTVDRRFIAKYPHVRPGTHVLITATEMRSDVDPNAPSGLVPEAAPDADRAAADRPGVDLGALLGLIGSCGGHLWMAADPPGNMVLKIHLPTRLATEPTEPGAPVTLAARGRSMARWFRH